MSYIHIPAPPQQAGLLSAGWPALDQMSQKQSRLLISSKEKWHTANWDVGFYT